MATSLRPCPQCRRMMDAGLALCAECERANGMDRTIQDPAPDVTVGMQTRPPIGPARPANPVVNGIGTGVGIAVGGCIVFPLLCLWLVGVGVRGCAATVQQPVGIQLPKPPARLGSEPAGPSLAQADAGLNDTNKTEAQRELYWRSIQGTSVTWTGDLFDATTNPPELHLRCNPQNSGADTYVKLEDSEIGKLGSLSKGRYVTVNAILREHTWVGYTLDAGRIVSP
jgi:hypothetical protein